jgi:hypothetical protein
MIRSEVFLQIHILAASLIYMKQIFAEPELKNTQNQPGCTTSKLARRIKLQNSERKYVNTVLYISFL